MAKKNGPQRPKKRTPKPKTVRRSIPADAIIYIPGQPLPAALENIVLERATNFAQEEVERRMSKGFAQVALGPTGIGEKCVDLLGTLPNDQKNLAMAHIVKFMVGCMNSRLQDAKRAQLDSDNALAAADNNSRKLDNILTGNFSTL